MDDINDITSWGFPKGRVSMFATVIIGPHPLMNVDQARDTEKMAAVGYGAVPPHMVMSHFSTVPKTWRSRIPQDGINKAFSTVLSSVRDDGERSAKRPRLE